ncbi:ABC transporter permease [Streptococcus phocae subsp. salmonis]|uniref:ABC transporter permease n=1 Tax=Streptococcus phocae TaxID=119224 RepID=UPI0005310FBB|nr:ABC transporter permease [Streptococcus phocae]KGR72861.1 multidrug ABC transporter permease [Streptococcus phocae subsp. salmonis]
MTELLLKRRQDFQKKHAKYLPYVFNDHFVLVLMFLLGFVLFQYSQLLKHFPENPLPIQLGLVIVIFLLLRVGSVAIYLEKADSHFLLTKEEEVIAHIKKAGRSSFVFWSGLQTALLALLFPLFLKLGLNVLMFIVMLLVLIVIKGWLIKRQIAGFVHDNGLDWDKAIAFEANRQQAILKFYSLFTNVKGISTSVKERSYLNPILKWVKKDSKQLWTNLYWRAFLRSSDYLGLSVRLLLLSCLSLALVPHHYLSLGLSFVFNYLILFQMLSLYHHYDYHYLATTYPDSQQLKADNLLFFLRQLSVVITGCNLLVSASFEKAGLILLLMLLLNALYLPHKLKKIID